MKHWIFISSPKQFRMHDWLATNEYVEYIQRNKVQVNDIVYLYTTAPVQRIEYKMIVDRINNLDTLEVQVEVEERVFSDEIKELEKLTKKIATVLQHAIGLAVKVKLVEPKSIERSMGKSVHVIDRRKMD